MNLIKATNLTVNYGSYRAIENVSLSINEGDYVCIVGANGSGKTTLLKTILGLLKPQSGTIERNIKSCGYLPQQTTIQKDFPASVFEVALSGCLNTKKIFSSFYTKQDKAKTLAQLQKLGIESLASKPFASLSGGQQQRVLLARSLLSADKLLALDEPVTGLDPIVTDELYSLIRTLNREQHLAILMISHDIHRAVQNATHIIQMNKTCDFFGTAEDYKNSQFFSQMASIETCATHLCNHCGPQCTSSHILLQLKGGAK